MSEHTPEPTPGDIPPPLDLSNLAATDAPMPDAGQPAPDHRASREPRKPRIGRRKPAGDRADDSPTAKRAKPRKPAPRAKKGQFTEPLTQMYVGAGMVLMPVDPVCANAVMQSAEACAKSLDELAYQNEAVRRALVAMTNTSAVGMVFVAHMPILAAVMMHHVPTVQRAMGKMGEEMAENIANSMGENNTGGETA